MKLLCTSCSEEKPTTEFFHRKPHKNGSREFSYDCKECRRLNRRQKEGHDNDFVTLKKILFGEESEAPALRICKICNEQKIARIDFYPKKWVCIPCTAIDQRSNYEQCLKCNLWRKKGTKCKKGCEHRTELRCAVCKKDGDKGTMYSARLCLECKNSGRLRSSVKKSGITVKDYEAMLEEQGGVCKICGNMGKNRLSVDHDHRTGVVRGLLCTNCNLGLGNFHDRPEKLLRAYEYLTQSSQVSPAD